MSIGPVEIVMIEFPLGWASGDVRDRIVELVEGGVVRVLDALLVAKDGDGTVEVVELEEADHEIAAPLGAVAQQFDLVSDEDVDELAESLAPGRSALIVVFEHTWMVPVQDAVVASGGVLVADIHVPPDVVAEVQAAMAES